MYNSKDIKVYLWLGLDVKITWATDETLILREMVNRVLNSFGNTSAVIVISIHINAGDW